MSAPLWVVQHARAFWELAGPRARVHYDLREPAEASGLLTVEMCAPLTCYSAADWLQRNNIPCPRLLEDRPLRACLVARGGSGFVFVNADDPPDEQRFSLAHEIAHFMCDYWQPRQEAVRRLGPAALEVLDGCRAPRPDEKLQGLFARVRLGFFTHLLTTGEPDEAIAHIEDQADRLAWELIAPARELDISDKTERQTLESRLVAEYGLPPAQARKYAQTLLPAAPRKHPLLLRLFHSEK